MLCNEYINKANVNKYIKEMYDILHSYVGRHGFEVKRTLGSSRKVVSQTDKNLLYYLSFNEDISP